jgi:DNA polymerase/3'-5' exonuclease PolX
MVLSEAQGIAAEVVDRLRPFCDRIEIGGSVRRQCAVPGDIEIVCIPKMDSGIPGLAGMREPGFLGTVDAWAKVKGIPEGKYTQRIHPSGAILDIFMCNKNNWGLIYAIRTGSAMFSHLTLARGWVKAGYRSVDGNLVDVASGMIIPVEEEADLFKLIGIEFIEPKFRV